MTIPDFGSEEERLEKEVGGNPPTIYEEAKAIYPSAKKKYGKTLKECYDAIVKIKGKDDRSWRE